MTTRGSQWIAVGFIAIALSAAPAQAEILEENPWDVLNRAGWGSIGGMIVTGAGTPDGPNALQYTYPAGFVGGRSAGTQEYVGGVLAGKTELYFGTWFKYSANWAWTDGSPGTGTKKTYHYLRNSNTDANNRSFFSQVNTNTRKIEVHNQPNFGAGTTVYRHNGCSGCVNPTVRVNTWYWLEIRAKLNTATASGYAADGILEVWLNDVKVMSHSNVPFRDTNLWTFHILKLYASWNSSAALVKPATDHLWFDQTIISTTRIGLAGDAPPQAPGSLTVR